MKKLLFIISFASKAIIACLPVSTANAQNSHDTVSLKTHPPTIVNNGAFYFSWGYNSEWYTKSNITVSQPSLNNKVTFVNIVAHDHEGWNYNFFHKPLTIPQYNYRIGYFFNQQQDWGFEINFDHAKYVVDPGQNVEMKGVYQGRNIDSIIVTSPKSIQWELNNGANFLEFNFVRKIKILDVWKSKIQLDALLKLGAGPVIPHVQNTIFGIDNIRHFQFGGFNVDADAAIRLTFFKHIFFELFDKVVYAKYWGLRLYDGTGKQAFGCYELALVVGGTFKL
jgi:hypothetical protein